MHIKTQRTALRTKVAFAYSKQTSNTEVTVARRRDAISPWWEDLLIEEEYL